MGLWEKFWTHEFKGDDLSEFAKPSLREHVANYITEAFSQSLFYYVVLTFSTYFYTDVIGLPAAAVGMVVLVSRLLDGVSDMLAGYLMDKTDSPYGRSRVWFFWTSIPYAISMALLYYVPHTSTAGQMLYVWVTYNFATTISYTLSNMSWNAITTFTTRNQKERDKLFSLRVGASNLGGAVASAIVLPLVAMAGGIYNQTSWKIVVTIFAVICYVLNIAGVFCMKERMKADKTSRENSNLDLPCTLKNPYFWCSIAVVGFYNVFQVATMTFMPYYAQYILGDTMLTSRILPIQSGLICATCFLVAWLQNKGVKKKTLVIVGSLIAIPGQLVFAMFPTNLPVIYVSTLLRGFGFGFTGACMFAFVGEAIEYGHWRFGHRAESTVSVANGIGNKLGVTIGAGLTTVMLGAVGYDGTLEMQPESALQLIRIVFIWAPVFFAILLIITMLLNKMNKMYDVIMSDLAAGRYHPKAEYAPAQAERSQAVKN